MKIGLVTQVIFNVDDKLYTVEVVIFAWNLFSLYSREHIKRENKVTLNKLVVNKTCLSSFSHTREYSNKVKEHTHIQVYLLVSPTTKNAKRMTLHPPLFYPSIYPLYIHTHTTLCLLQAVAHRASVIDVMNN